MDTPGTSQPVLDYIYRKGGYRSPMIASSFNVEFSKDWLKKL